MLEALRGCLGRAPSNGILNAKSESQVALADCIFCGITKERGFNVVFENDAFSVFHDRSPGARMHLLCVPKRHLDNVKTLSADDIPMLHAMKEIGTHLLEEAGFASTHQRLGFHIPPFFSVNHLHLHCLGLPCVTAYDRFKYRPSQTPSSGKRSKGFSHFVELDQAMAILNKGGKVGVLPC